MQLIYLPLEHVFPCYDNNDSLITDNCGSRPTPQPSMQYQHTLSYNQPSKSSQVLHISILLMWKESDGKTTEVATFFVRNLTQLYPFFLKILFSFILSTFGIRLRNYKVEQLLQQQVLVHYINIKQGIIRKSKVVVQTVLECILLVCVVLSNWIFHQ